MAICPEQHQRSRQLFLWMMASVYLFALVSLYSQIPGLYGPQGLTPVNIPERPSEDGWLQRWLTLPSLVEFHRELGLSPHHTMELCCLLGAALAALAMAFRPMRCSLVFLLLWLLYLSLYKVGQVFMWFQWDSLLLEAGLLAVVVAPFNLLFWKRPAPEPHDGIGLWLLRWLLFRLMFASGVVKLTSQCPTWWGLTALDYHYETQCIPTPLAWYAHQLPHWVQRLSVVTTYVIEIATPILFFMPVRSLRLLGFWAQVFLQVLIILTGNYNFFNLLTIALCISLLDDHCLTWRKTKASSSLSSAMSDAVFGDSGHIVLAFLRAMAFLTVAGYMIAATVFYFDITVDVKKWMMLSDIRFTSNDLNVMLNTAVPLVALFAFLSLVVEVVNAMINSLFKPGFVERISSVLHTGVYAFTAASLFTVSLVPYGMLDRSFFHSLPSPVIKFHSSLDKYSVTNSYGLFRRMTGTDGRPELIVEGTNDLEGGQWQEYDFLYKPGKVVGVLPYVAPHQPRLDWQMWFAALGNYQNNPWLVHLVYKLLSGQKEVLQLLAPPPFDAPPKHIKVSRFAYHFTGYDHDMSIFNQSEKWWQREFIEEYLFPLSSDNPGLLDYLHKQNYLKQSSDVQLTSLAKGLQWLRDRTDLLTPCILLWSAFSGAVLPALAQFVW